ncbi:sigma-54-dependent Fis family transcriptional regulator [Desulfosporosinus fructosivorans]|uniref:Sigma-54-dependent Fis family transcriptional regulator n=1 Tax=Desulfosporosinus fructosivorans TaxID=2018669 RepID=A0A4Z0R271_9FIRM|nr:sigma-54-dependent Fis family transcriptional regulator [Desulfosporosinus fructosivorans]TGE37182.1 sigma-54-dependent Fis family transcriptional regulator [Desulfosporosinus fructosivorans]
MILDSWDRCHYYKVNPIKAKPITVYQGIELETHVNKYRKLIDVSLPVMKNLFNFVGDGNFVIVLADEQGCLLEMYGDEKVKSSAIAGDFVPGVDWSEKTIGNNGVGTALFLDKPVQIFGREHYWLEAHHWTCSGAPIHDPQGRLIGALVISGSYEKVHPHTLGMAVTAVNAIENQLKLEETVSLLELSNNYKNAIIESISEGLLAVDEEGQITQINSIAAQYLEHNAAESLKGNCDTIFGDKNSELKNMIKFNRQVTDHEVDIFIGKVKTTYLVTTRPIKGNGINKGTVLLLNEISRAQKLVQRMSGARVNCTFLDLVGEEPAYLETVELARKAADSTSNVLLLGESGTGKDVFAQAIHNTGIRKRGPFVALNCGAIPRELIASELFGYVEGAFTGASRGGKMGKFELASGGTIFLDEIGEMPLELQTSLLRVLETKTITRVSGNDVIPVDVRIIAATNKDLSLEVSQGKFRQDLFYRLNVFAIRMVPLRERKEDIALFTKRILDNLCIKFKKPAIKPDKNVLEIFNKYPWPGNIRELQNVLERVVNVCNDTILSIDHLPVEIRSTKTRGNYMPIKNYERDLIESLLEQHNRNITRVANELGVARTTLYQKIAKYKL